MSRVHRIRVIDSHTGGEPTRIVIEGGPNLPRVPLAECRDILRNKHDAFRRTIIDEPRGAEVLVGGLLLEPIDPTNAAGVVFFNNVGYLGMCGHGTIGLVRTLQHLGKIDEGEHRIESPVGVVTVRLDADGTVTVRNVPSRRSRKAVALEVPGIGTITGDIAWGGNWFFLVAEHCQSLVASNIPTLTDFTLRIRAALETQGITGDDGGEIDHIELFGPSEIADSKNFVLCPGGAYDRSPCGTGTSAKLACLVADGRLSPGEVWRQESIVGSVFEGSVELVDDQIIPSIRGRAYLTAETTLFVEVGDPFGEGIPR